MRKRRFLASWTEEFPWLQRRAGRQDVCSWCSCHGTPLPFADKNSPLVLGSGSEGKYKKDGLITHDRSQAHRRVEAAHKTQRGPMDTVIEKMTNEKTAVIVSFQYSLPRCQIKIAIPPLSASV